MDLVGRHLSCYSDPIDFEDFPCSSAPPSLTSCRPFYPTGSFPWFPPISWAPISSGAQLTTAASDFSLTKTISTSSSWSTGSPCPRGERVAKINALRDAKLELEASLLRKLGRERASEQIVSLVPVTPFEVDQAVHKDAVKHILTGARAYDLFKRSEIESLDGGRSSSPVADAHRSVLSFVQKKRAEALSVAPNGRGGMAPQAHDDPVPKDLMRNFAVATADLEKHNDISDLARGLREISDFASASADWTPLTTAFAQWLAVRQGARGTVDPVISPDHYLLLVEDQVRSRAAAISRSRWSPLHRTAGRAHDASDRCSHAVLVPPHERDISGHASGQDGRIEERRVARRSRRPGEYEGPCQRTFRAPVR